MVNKDLEAIKDAPTEVRSISSDKHLETYPNANR